MKEIIIVTEKMTKALKLEDLHAKVLKEEKPKIVILLKEIGFRFGRKKEITVKPEGHNVI
ncbi:MAG: hypothetical protein QY322_00405 [bacterium]|nr:MAG: hypothetical protein QY322_00405 [bacterium]